MSFAYVCAFKIIFPLQIDMKEADEGEEKGEAKDDDDEEDFDIVE